MGIYNSKPIMEMVKDEGSVNKHNYCSCSVQGWRKGQEDSYVTLPKFAENCSLFGIFDGHGGFEVSKLTAAKLSEFLHKNPNFERGDFKEALEETFLEFDMYLRSEDGNAEMLSMRQRGVPNDDEDPEDIDLLLHEANMPLVDLIKEYNMEKTTVERESGLDWTEFLDDSDDDEEVDMSNLEEGDSETESEEEDYSDNTPELEKSNDAAFDCGTTAVVALVTGGKVVVANAGDSRCVLSRGGECVALSEDHKPEDEKESDRIKKAGSQIMCGRVDNGLNLSRALGDWRYKETDGLGLKEQAITSMPDVTQMLLQEEDEFMLMATDGIWNSMSSDDVICYVRHHLNRIPSVSLSDICEQLFNSILSDNTTGDGTGCDNMTCTIVLFKDRDYFTSLPPIPLPVVEHTNGIHAIDEEASNSSEEVTLNSEDISNSSTDADVTSLSNHGEEEPITVVPNSSTDEDVVSSPKRHKSDV